jgi:hypothetical protein
MGAGILDLGRRGQGLWLPGRLALVVVLIALAGCSLFGTPEPELGPSEVVNRFYRWCIGYPGNPLVDREYRNSPDLAPTFIESVDTALASMDLGGADPLLLAQDIPERFTVDEAQISGDRATVIVNFYWGGSDVPSPREIELQLLDGAWLITHVRMVH